MMDYTTNLPAPANSGRGRLSTVEPLADIPEETIWLQKQKSAGTRRAYRLDVQLLGITTPAELRQADHKAVIAWERYMGETECAAASTIRWRLAALSSHYKHLVRHGHAARNPVGEVERPAINRDEGATLAFSKAQARQVLDAPPEDTIAGLRDRAILSVGLQVGLRRAEIAALKVGDLHQKRGYDFLRVAHKGGRRDALAINPQAAARIRAYLDLAGHGADVDCSGRSGITASARTSTGAWTRMRLTARCANTPASSGLTAATRRTRCAPPSSPPRSKTARSLKTCRRPPGIATRARPSCTIGAATTPRWLQAFLRHIEHHER
jgi:site-specific recombinase XerC